MGRRRDESTEIIRGDVLELGDNNILFAIFSDPDNICYVPFSMIIQPEPIVLRIEDDIELEVKGWWYHANRERFEDGD